MDADFARIVANCTVRLAASAMPLRDAMVSVVDVCRAERPHDDWQRILDLDFDGDLDRLEAWLLDSVDAAPVPAEVAAYFVGIGEWTYADRETCDIDGYGADASGKAVWTLPCARSTVLDGIYRVAYPASRGGQLDGDALGDPGSDASQQLGNDGEYSMALAYAVLAVATLLRRPGVADALGGPKDRTVAVGFHDGDIVDLATISTSEVRIDPEPF